MQRKTRVLAEAHTDFVYLSEKNAKRVLEWSFANEQQHPAAAAYLGCCCAVASIGGRVICEWIEEGTENSRSRRTAKKAKVSISNLAYQLRDTLGRMILEKELKRIVTK